MSTGLKVSFVRDFNNCFFQVLENIIRNKKTAISGDLIQIIVDINIRSPSHAEQVFFYSYRSDYFKSLFNKPTRISKQFQTCIDHLDTSVCSDVLSVVLKLKKYGSLCSILFIFSYTETPRNYTLRFRDHLDVNIEKFKTKHIHKLPVLSAYEASR